MAEVRQRCRRGVHYFALKIYNRSCLEIQRKQGKRQIRTLALSPGFPLADSHLGGSGKAADRVTAGLLQGYTRAAPLFGNVDHVCDQHRHDEFEYLIGLKGHLFSNKTQAQRRDRIKTKYRGSGMFQRTFGGSSPPHSLHSVRLCCGQFIRAYSSNGSRSEPLYKSQTGYYDILQVTPKATQAQIKTAYYKQSFIYHPDRNAGSEEATVRFSEINEAYTVLGNKALRKKYDRGLLNMSDLIATVRPTSTKETPGSSTKQQTESQRTVVGTDRQGRVFDFDTFIKEHYGEQLQKQKDLKDRKAEMLRKKEESVIDKNLGKSAEVGLIVMLMTAVALLVSCRGG